MTSRSTGVRAREGGRVDKEAAGRHRSKEPVLAWEGRPLDEAKRAWRRLFSAVYVEAARLAATPTSVQTSSAAAASARALAAAPRFAPVPLKYNC
ncbi:hypothetical protein ZWY2020_020206 [Hordeum vulgare]|nr:hypothetical protein ZWY2020_020206 [Hordeum vulgare]